MLTCCLKCNKNTENVDSKLLTTKNGNDNVLIKTYSMW